MVRVGFIGLGLMGGPMAANIARAGYPLAVYNRTASKASPLRSLGATAAASPKEVAQVSQVVLTMLADAAAVEAVLHGDEGLLAGGRPGMVLIDMSTVSPAQSRRLASELAGHGWKMLDAPVFGSTGPAKEGTLGILVGGETSVFEENREILSRMGKYICHFGPNGSGAAAKLCFNLMVASQVAGLAEAMTLAARSGLDLARVGEAILASPVASSLIQRKVPLIVNGDFAAAFPLKHMHKDLGLMLDTGHDILAPLPVTGGMHELFTAARACGHGDQDFAAVFLQLMEMAGLSSKPGSRGPVGG
jgi:3-hydroxyisobutyrate dehydrogenase-like beta-hydroxyacid dehydrogenase